MDIKIVNGVVSAEHLHIFASIPPHVAVSEFVKKVKGRSSIRFYKRGYQCPLATSIRYSGLFKKTY
ncbi:MAG: transposase [Coxiellaceae bacterium]|nr:transposase [Coxiellaceae bacterium]